jgi:hypothetical protein
MSQQRVKPDKLEHLNQRETAYYSETMSKEHGEA